MPFHDSYLFPTMETGCSRVFNICAFTAPHSLAVQAKPSRPLTETFPLELFVSRIGSPRRVAVEGEHSERQARSGRQGRLTGGQDLFG